MYVLVRVQIFAIVDEAQEELHLRIWSRVAKHSHAKEPRLGVGEPEKGPEDPDSATSEGLGLQYRWSLDILYRLPIPSISLWMTGSSSLVSGRLMNSMILRSRIENASRKARSTVSGVPSTAAGSGTPQ